MRESVSVRVRVCGEGEGRVVNWREMLPPAEDNARSLFLSPCPNLN
jgi:hypothetical protein